MASDLTATYDAKNKRLNISVPCNSTPQPSSSGKTLIVATSGGNKTVGLQIGGKDLYIGLNAYIKNDGAPAGQVTQQG